MTEDKKELVAIAWRYLLWAIIAVTGALLGAPFAAFIIGFCAFLMTIETAGNVGD